MNNISMAEKILPAFRKPWHAVKRGEHLYYVFKGGRNSSKSTHIAVMLIYELMKYPISALCMRKVGETIEGSIYEQLLWAIDYLGVSDLWKVNKSPLKLTYLLRGNTIMFRGADKPEKIKSIKSSKFPIARLWVEELAEFHTEDDVSTIVNSIVRAELSEGLTYKIFYSYNPPKRKQSWVNKLYESRFVADNVYVHHSTYLDNPHLATATIQVAETLKERSPLKYEWEWLGKPIGSGIVPFDNLVFRTITDEEMANFDNIRQGIDWGYAADPFAFVRWHYDRMRRRIFCMDEIYQVKMSNRQAAEEIQQRGYDWMLTLADSAEPKSVAELYEYGISIEGVKKGPGSVEYGEKWLDDLEEIVIDPKRTPNTAREFESIDYMTDKDGNLRSKLEDKDNHTIDSTRYAMSYDMSGEYEPERVITPSIGGVSIRR